MSVKIIESAYEMIGDLTPLKSDCARMCGAACCESEGYMLLFPYERDLVEKCDGFQMMQKHLEGYGPVEAVTCSGYCERNLRPLSCRIFPLAPKFIDGELFVRLDPRGRSVCPLAHKSILSLDKDFTNTIKKTLKMLAQDDSISRYLKAVSDVADKFNDIFA